MRPRLWIARLLASYALALATAAFCYVSPAPVRAEASGLGESWERGGGSSGSVAVRAHELDLDSAMSRIVVPNLVERGGHAASCSPERWARLAGAGDIARGSSGCSTTADQSRASASFAT